ncbi:hypothetical protein MXF13_22110 [Leclercia adecarboxylata]|nr:MULTISPECIES: hypothetical protein [Leclercia]MCU6680504.1 hypothetical protein [Leclercia tamurae]MEB5752561.1 hypothetical protein [Leclercia adecarboxylata]
MVQYAPYVQHGSRCAPASRNRTEDGGQRGGADNILSRNGATCTNDLPGASIIRLQSVKPFFRHQARYPRKRARIINHQHAARGDDAPCRPEQLCPALPCPGPHGIRVGAKRLNPSRGLAFK